MPYSENASIVTVDDTERVATCTATTDFIFLYWFFYIGNK